MTRAAFDLEEYLARHSVAVSKTKNRPDGGLLFELETCPWDPSHKGTAFAGQWPNGGAIYAGCHHNSCSAKSWQDLRDTLEGGGWRDRKAPPGGQRGEESVRGELVVVRADTVQAEAVRWLWEGRIACGAVNLIDGDPGKGKSLVTTDLAARVTYGYAMPGEPEGARHEPTDTIILSYEDDPATTIVPRLRAAGADLTRVHIIEGVRCDDDVVPPSLPEDLKKLEALAVKVNARLIIVDPLMAALSGELDAHKDQDVRRALSRLKDLARRTGAAVVVIRHRRKTTGGPAIYSGGGSIGIIGAARAAHLVAQDPNDPDTRIIAPTKTNIGPPIPAIRFRIEGCAVACPDGAPISTCRVDWRGEAPGISADDLVAPAENAKPEDRTESEEATSFLHERLAGGERHLSNEVQREARKGGITAKTLQRARRKLGVKSKRFTDPATEKLAWYVWLPRALDGQDGSIPAERPSSPPNAENGEKSQPVADPPLDGQPVDQQEWPSTGAAPADPPAPESAPPAKPRPSDKFAGALRKNLREIEDREGWR